MKDDFGTVFRAMPRVEPANDPAETAGPVLTVPGAPLAFHVMAKPTGAVCNLDCDGWATARRQGASRADGGLRETGLPARPQRPVQLRQRPQMETLPRSRAAASSLGQAISPDVPFRGAHCEDRGADARRVTDFGGWPEEALADPAGPRTLMPEVDELLRRRPGSGTGPEAQALRSTGEVSPPWGDAGSGSREVGSMA